MLRFGADNQAIRRCYDLQLFLVVTQYRYMK